MAEAAQRHQNELERIKKNIERSYEYNQKNYKSFNEFRKFLYISGLTDSDIALLDDLKKPQLEFNVLEAYVSRLKGEFSKQEPSIEVTPDFGDNVDPNLLKAVEGHLRHILANGDNDNFAYHAYDEMLSGGFSVLETWTDYANETSFNQTINVGKAKDPTLCGFDPLAKLPHKADGRFCFKMFPKSKEEFEEEYSDINIEELKFARSAQGFNWSYNNNNEDVLLIVDYYEKKRKKVRIVQLSNQQTMLASAYEDFKQEWIDSMRIEQVPEIVQERMTEIEKIVRYRIIENKVIEYIETDYKYFPLVFAAGNTVTLRDSISGNVCEHHRPYIYHAKGIQKLKNFAGQTLANELENMVQHKFKVPKEGIPDGYEEAYRDIQHADVLVYNSLKPDDPSIQLPPPMEIQRAPIPPEITGAFSSADQSIQSILGSYDASLGINNNQLSGIAIVEGATQSNSAAMPYIVGYLQALNQIAQIIIDLIPKYYVTPRTIPVKQKDGSRSFVKINQPGEIDVNYDENALQVRVTAGVNFSVQKSRALQQIIALMQASPAFAQFMNAQGLPILLDNIECRGVDELKNLAQKYMQQMQQQQAQQGQNNPALLKAQNDKMDIMREAKKDQTDAQLKAAELKLKAEELNQSKAKLVMDTALAHNDQMVEVDKHKTEKQRSMMEVAGDMIDRERDHAKDVLTMHHNHSKDIHGAIMDNRNNDIML